MNNVVTFETAKRLKEAGFPQPEICLNQGWYDQSGKLYRIIKWSESSQSDDLVLIGDWLGDWDIIGQKEQFLLFAPTATDIMRHLPGYQLTHNGETFVMFPPNDELRDWEHDNPAEACAEAWLKHKK